MVKVRIRLCTAIEWRCNLRYISGGSTVRCAIFAFLIYFGGIPSSGVLLRYGGTCDLYSEGLPCVFSEVHRSVNSSCVWWSLTDYEIAIT